MTTKTDATRSYGWMQGGSERAEGGLEGVDSWDLIPWLHYNAFVSYVSQIVYKFQISFVINLLNRKYSFTKATYSHLMDVTILLLLAATCFGGTSPSS
jgi:hypothetical protein